MSVARRDGSWQVRWTNTAGKRCSKTFTRKADAEEYERKQRSLARAGEAFDPTNARITIAEIYPSWIKTKAALKQKTVIGYESTWRNVVEPRWGGMPLSKITLGDVKAWTAGCTSSKGKRLGATKTREAYYVLSMICDHAVDNGLIGRNPARPSSGSSERFLPKAPDSSARNILQEDELRRVADESGEYRDFILLLGMTGLRFYEACALKPGDIDFARNEIHVRRTLSDVGSSLIEQPPKNSKSRKVHLPEALRATLRKRVLAARSDEYVFRTPQGCTIRNQNFARRVWHPALKRAKIKKNVTIHDLRHTAASWLIEQGVNIMELSRMLGHSDPAITLRRYGHLYNEDFKRLGAAIDLASRAFA